MLNTSSKQTASVTDGYLWVEGAAALPYFTRRHMLTLDQVEEFRKRHNNTGIFTTAYCYSNPQQQGAIFAPHFYLDLDNAGLVDPDPVVSREAWRAIQEDIRRVVAALEVDYGIGREQVEIYFSGKKGLSVLVPTATLGLGPDEKLNQIFRLIAGDLAKQCAHKTLDLQIYDRLRLFRLANSRHEETGLYKIPLTVSEALSFPLTVLQWSAQGPRRLSSNASQLSSRAVRRINLLLSRYGVSGLRKRSANTFSYIPPCVQNLTQDTICAGRRNNTLAILSSFYMQQGRDSGEVAELIGRFNAEHCRPPLPSREVQGILRSVFRHEYRWGCHTLSQTEYCRQEQCRIACRR